MEILYVSKSIFWTKSGFTDLMSPFVVLSLFMNHDVDSQGVHMNPVQFYDFLQNRVLIIMRPKFEEPNHDHPEFKLVLSKKQNYDVVRTASDMAWMGC